MILYKPRWYEWPKVLWRMLTFTPLHNCECRACVLVRERPASPAAYLIKSTIDERKP